MAAFRSEQEHVVVAVLATSAEADFVKMTLAAHGVAAHSSVSDPAHPSLNFVDGIRVSVRPEDEEEARALLGQLHDPE